ncbi:hypothetical protein NE237_021678 [Protea cynaroides]|uniref:Retrovirus-related Pol polyprotein from transposon TNT 1-94-like beta-barrel domain-containing protein n=1 Tax=Protea cynaroides TaxID=273540 RepID=A0A9Q0H8Z7_9MAGN|nr:hypothetical protein NE237_021678 [Protea cynaroides]
MGSLAGDINGDINVHLLSNIRSGSEKRPEIQFNGKITSYHIFSIKDVSRARNSYKLVHITRCWKIGHIKKRVRLSKANVACEAEEDDDLNWEQCFTTEVVEGTNQALVNYVDYKEEWIIDSGYSHHVTGNDSLFSEVRLHNGEQVIVTADNSTYPVAKEGAVKIGIDDTNVKLNDVNHVPGFKKNLVSVSQITNSGKYVLFCPNEVKVLDNVKNIVADVVLTGEKKGSLFIMSVGRHM